MQHHGSCSQGQPGAHTSQGAAFHFVHRQQRGAVARQVDGQSVGARGCVSGQCRWRGAATGQDGSSKMATMAEETRICQQCGGAIGALYNMVSTAQHWLYCYALLGCGSSSHLVPPCCVCRVRAQRPPSRSALVYHAHPSCNISGFLGNTTTSLRARSVGPCGARRAHCGATPLVIERWRSATGRQRALSSPTPGGLVIIGPHVSPHQQRDVRASAASPAGFRSHRGLDATGSCRHHSSK
jgi:hypothetical protein